MHRLDLRIPPLLLAAVALAGIAAAAWLWPSANRPFPGHAVLAIVASVVGVAVAVAGVVQFRRLRTTVNPMTPQASRTVVDGGVYRITRNPMYLGMALALLGAAAWRSSLPGYAIVAGFVAWIDRFQIVPEERALAARFGGAYDDYRRRVRRWL